MIFLFLHKKEAKKQVVGNQAVKKLRKIALNPSYFLKADLCIIRWILVKFEN